MGQQMDHIGSRIKTKEGFIQIHTKYQAKKCSACPLNGICHKSAENRIVKLIHHSDRGVQYCSDEYQKYLKKHKITCSMTENSDPYENVIAERINGILKQEFRIDIYHLEL